MTDIASTHMASNPLVDPIKSTLDRQLSRVDLFDNRHGDDGLPNRMSQNKPTTFLYANEDNVLVYNAVLQRV